jgi:uncharacterized protein YkwD
VDSSGSADPAAAAATIADQIFTLTNQARQANDLGTVEYSGALAEAAQIQASAMALLDVMSHDLTGMPQPTFASRLQYVGYDADWAAENIGFGATGAGEIFGLWMSSAPHAENILSPEATATGVGVAYDSSGALYFCQVFAAPPLP